MATLIVETGLLVANANTFVTTADADTYWANRNRAEWADLEPAAKQAALIIAAQFLEHNYKFVGSRVNSDQALCWPRYIPYGLDADDRWVKNNVIPQRVKDAQVELAFYHATVGELDPVLERGGKIVEESVGPLSVKYSDSAPGYKTFSLVDKILRDLLDITQDSFSAKAVRA